MPNPRRRQGFCNLLMTKVDGSIVLDPPVASCCVIELDEDGATAIRDAVTVWLG
ncbi:MAG: hypothetical protein M3Y73_00770 [Actinomycetota bacterium]|nr:hypothetical protein [Actinomycetota bacterium]